MEIREYDLNSYKLHIIKSNKVKTCHMEIHFREKVKKENLHYKSFLCDILTDCSKNLVNRKEVVIKLEELYKASFYGTTSKTGSVINTMFVYNFIAPEFIKEKNYLEDVLSLPFDMILNPNLINKEFEPKIFNVVKERMKRDIEGLNENPQKLSINNSLKEMDENSVSTYSILGSINDVDKITPQSLYEEYLNMINTNTCDIFVIGNLDFDEVYRIVSKKFKLKTIKTEKLNLHVENKIVKKIKKKNEKSEFVQTNLSLVYNLDNIAKEKKNIDMQVFNYIFGSGGMSSKLYQKVREENSLCYGIYSIYLKYDNLLIVQVSLDESNKDKAIKLINESLKEMINGKITESTLVDTKRNLLMSLSMALDNNISILSNYIFKLYDELPEIEKRMELIKKVTIDDIKNVAKKIKLNTIYSLQAKEGK